jgi:hypothetical protein
MAANDIYEPLAVKEQVIFYMSSIKLLANFIARYGITAIVITVVTLVLKNNKFS